MLLTVRKVRLERGIGLAEAADRIGIAPAVLSRIETGQQIAWRGLRLKLARLYGVDEREIFAELDQARDYLKRLGGEQHEDSPATS